eukprot:s121_g38.t1
MDFHFVWQAWHLATWTFTLCGRRGTYSTQLGLVTRLVAVDAASFCVAGVALGDIDLYFVWQAWHLTTWTFTLCGRRGAYGTQLGLVTRLVAVDAASFCVASVALKGTWTWGHGPSLCVAGVALTALSWAVLVEASPWHQAWPAPELVASEPQEARPGFSSCSADEYEDFPEVLAAKAKLVAGLLRSRRMWFSMICPETSFPSTCKNVDAIPTGRMD